MHCSFAYLIGAGLALAAGSTALSAVVPAPRTIDIVVDAAPLRQYAHGGRLYVEARKGKAYAIRIRNPYGVRVAVALSVDGLNTIDATETTARQARKWVLDPYQTITIGGWQTSESEARRFEFTTEERSYGRALGKTTNLGVISAVFFRERVPEYVGRERNSRKANEGRLDELGTDASRLPRAAAPDDAGAASSRADTNSAGAARNRAEEYAATGMGGRTAHPVTKVWLDLEATPAHGVDVRYEYRAQLVRLGILPSPPAREDRLGRRERAHGFRGEFCPIPSGPPPTVR